MNPSSGNESQYMIEPIQSRAYKFWPVYTMAFLRTFFFAIYSLALPNHLIFKKNLEPSLVGFIGSASALGYILGPFLGRKITKKLGIKNTIIITQITCVSSIILSILFIDPTVLVIVRFIDGVVNGFFWPNVLNLLGKWEKDQPPGHKTDFLKNFNYSWNFGLIGGYIIGYFIVFFIGSDYTALIFSAIVVSFLIPSAFSMEKSENFMMVGNRAVIIQDLKIQTRYPDNFQNSNSDTSKDNESPMKDLGEGKSKEKTSPSLSHVPLLMAFGGIIVYASTKSIFKFTLPYFFIFADLDSYWVYGVVLFQQIFHMMGLSLIAKKSKKRNGYFLGMGILFSLTLIFLFNISIIIVVIMNIIAGLCIGIMQGAVQRIILDHSKAKDSQLYTMWGEVFMGISFGIMPIIAGVLTEIDLRYDFLFLAILLIVLGFILVLKQIKFYRQEKDGNDS